MTSHPRLCVVWSRGRRFKGSGAYQSRKYQYNGQRHRAGRHVLSRRVSAVALRCAVATGTRRCRGRTAIYHPTSVRSHGASTRRESKMPTNKTSSLCDVSMVIGEKASAEPSASVTVKQTAPATHCASLTDPALQIPTAHSAAPVVWEQRAGYLPVLDTSSRGFQRSPSKRLKHSA